MKKLFMLLLTVVAAVTITSCSCSDNQSFGFVYSLQSEGLTNGFVDMTFINGNFNIKGDAEYVFSWTNDVPKNFTEMSAINLDEALACNEEITQKAAVQANDWLESAIQINDYDGTYDIRVKGYIMETMTGIKFEIDKRYTNAVDEDPEVEPEAE